MSLLNLTGVSAQGEVGTSFGLGQRLFPDKMQIGRTLMNLKHLAGQVLMTAKHQIGKR
jgi:hypothetical protein